MLVVLMISIMIIVFVIIAMFCAAVHYMLIVLPNKQLRILDKFVPCIVQQISQDYAMLGIIQQRQIATEKIEDIFKELGVHGPHSAIEADVANALHQKKATWIEELIKDQLAERDTEQMPTIKENMWIL